MFCFGMEREEGWVDEESRWVVCLPAFLPLSPSSLPLTHKPTDHTPCKINPSLLLAAVMLASKHCATDANVGEGKGWSYAAYSKASGLAEGELKVCNRVVGCGVCAESRMDFKVN